jgi:hypothetical protein
MYCATLYYTILYYIIDTSCTVRFHIYGSLTALPSFPLQYHIILLQCGLVIFIHIHILMLCTALHYTTLHYTTLQCACKVLWMTAQQQKERERNESHAQHSIGMTSK